MRKIVHRHLGKVVAGAAIAVAGTAVMVGITLPGSAGADDSSGGGALDAGAAWLARCVPAGGRHRVAGAAVVGSMAGGGGESSGWRANR